MMVYKQKTYISSSRRGKGREKGAKRDHSKKTTRRKNASWSLQGKASGVFYLRKGEMNEKRRRYKQNARYRREKRARRGRCVKRGEGKRQTTASTICYRQSLH